jgi:hypothetical protein
MSSLALPDPGQALARLLFYAAGALILAYLVFRQRDLNA